MTKAENDQEPIDSPAAEDRAQEDTEEQGPDDLAGDAVSSDVAMPKAPAAQAIARERGDRA